MVEVAAFYDQNTERLLQKQHRLDDGDQHRQEMRINGFLRWKMEPASWELGLVCSPCQWLYHGHNRQKRTSLQANPSRLVRLRCVPPPTLTHPVEMSSRNTSRRFSVEKQLQGCIAAHQVRYSSDQKFSNATTVDLELFSNKIIDDRALPATGQLIYDPSIPSKNAAAGWEPHPYEDFHIGRRWKEIEGDRNWEGLLDPLDPILRSELIRYGEFAQATYDAFDYAVFSRFCGSCKFRKTRFFEKLALENRGYEIEQYLYSTSEIHLPKFFLKSDVPDDKKWSKYSNWVGFVAVCTAPEEITRLGRRDVVVAWRGTVTDFEWIENIHMSLCPTGVDPRRVGKGSPSSRSVDLKVERGFLSLYKSKNKDSRYNKSSARDQVLGALKRLMEKYEGEEMSITVTGHSLGGALATLCAYDIVESGLNVLRVPCSSTSDIHLVEESKLQISSNVGTSGRSPVEARVPITVYTFAAPRVGNSAFKDRLDELGVKVLRVVNIHDLVPCVPGMIFNEKLKFVHMKLPTLKHCLLVKLVQKTLDLLPATYSHVGVELQLDNLQSPFLRRSRSPFATHNLEVHLHLLDGFQGKSSGGFSRKLYGGRDLALVNKGTSLLTREHQIPPFWFQEENKGLVRIGGRFTYQPREPEDFPERPLHQDNFDLLPLKEPRNQST